MAQDMFKELFKVLNILTPSVGLFTSQTIVLCQVRIHCLYELIAKNEPHNLRLLCLLNTWSSMHNLTTQVKNDRARKQPAPGNSSDFVEAVFRKEIFPMICGRNTASMSQRFLVFSCRIR